MTQQKSARALAAVCLGLAVLGCHGAVRAEEKKAATIDPRAERILRAAFANVAAAKNFTFSAEVARDVPQDSGQKVQYFGTLRTAVRRPDRLFAAYRGEDRENAMFYDGKTFVLSNPADRVYASWAAPATMQELFATMKEKIGFVPPLSVLLNADAGAGEVKNLRSGVYVGRVTLRGVDCHHLAFSGLKNDFQLWVSDGDAIIRRVVVTYRDVPTAPQYAVNFLEWNLNANLSDYLFTHEPAPGDNRIEFKATRKP